MSLYCGRPVHHKSGAFHPSLSQHSKHSTPLVILLTVSLKVSNIIPNKFYLSSPIPRTISAIIRSSKDLRLSHDFERCWWDIFRLYYNYMFAECCVIFYLTDTDTPNHSYNLNNLRLHDQSACYNRMFAWSNLRPIIVGNLVTSSKALWGLWGRCYWWGSLCFSFDKTDT